MKISKAGKVFAALVVLAGISSCASQAPQSTITVLGPWTGTKPGTEGYDFQSVLNAFTKSTNIAVHYVGTRALDQVLQSEVQKGDPPDLADLSSPELVANYANHGDLFRLDKVLNQPQLDQSFSKQWLQLDMAGTKYLYAVTVKADVKSIIWYDPQHLADPPTTGNQLLNLGQSRPKNDSLPWCLGVADTTASGWPGTDWIADILLHQSGQTAYQEWTDGTLPWTSPQVKEAWQTWGKITSSGLIYGGSTSALLTSYSDAGAPLFSRQPGCYLDHEGSFIMSDYESDTLPGGGHPQPGTNFNFFQFPKLDSAGSTATQVSADFMGMFRDSSQARRLIQYLASAPAQKIWPSIRNGGAFSVDQKVPLSIYKNPVTGTEDQVSSNIVNILASRSGTLCFDAADLMPQPMQTAFYQGVLEYLQNPGQLNEILNGLDSVRSSVYQSALSFKCGT